jgi:hypothetical protein
MMYGEYKPSRRSSALRARLGRRAVDPQRTTAQRPWKGYAPAQLGNTRQAAFDPAADLLQPELSGASSGPGTPTIALPTDNALNGLHAVTRVLVNSFVNSSSLRYCTGLGLPGVELGLMRRGSHGRCTGEGGAECAVVVSQVRTWFVAGRRPTLVVDAEGSVSAGVTTLPMMVSGLCQPLCDNGEASFARSALARVALFAGRTPKGGETMTVKKVTMKRLTGTPWPWWIGPGGPGISFSEPRIDAVRTDGK